VTHPEPVQWSRAIGQRIRFHRSRAGRTQAEIALLMRKMGVPWTKSKETRVEAGDTLITVPELILAAIGLGVPLRELLPKEGTIQLSNEASIEAGALRQLFDGEAFTPTSRGVSCPLSDLAAQISPKRMSAAVLADLQDIDAVVAPYLTERGGPRLLEIAYGSHSEPTRTIAADLGIDAVVVEAIAHQNYGFGVVEERDRRVDERAPADTPRESRSVIRGHVTRELSQEIRSTYEGTAQ
jgi:transcriptional regulator with XRE-family HTH domain